MKVGAFVKQFLPRGLLGRSLIIIVAPMVLLQGVVTYVFFERDLDTTTRLLARDVAADVSLLATLEDSTPTLQHIVQRLVGEAAALPAEFSRRRACDTPAAIQHHRQGAGRCA